MCILISGFNGFKNVDGDGDDDNDDDDDGDDDDDNDDDDDDDDDDDGDDDDDDDDDDYMVQHEHLYISFDPWTVEEATCLFSILKTEREREMRLLSNAEETIEGTPHGTTWISDGSWKKLGRNFRTGSSV